MLSARFAFDLRGEFFQIDLLASGGEFVWQQVPILREAYGAARWDGLARAMGLEFDSGHLLGLRIPEAKGQAGDLGIHAIFRGRVTLHERLVVRHEVGKPARVGVEAELRET